jgi:hypothetical protein
MVQTPTKYPTASAAQALVFAESGDKEGALALLLTLPAHEWDGVAGDLSEGLAMALAASACSVIGPAAGPFASQVYEAMRPYAGTAVVVRAPATGCFGPADHYLGLLAETMGDLALAEVHHEAALRLARRMDSPPFMAATEVELARTLRHRRPSAEQERVSTLLRHGEESARALGLHRLAQQAAAPG